MWCERIPAQPSLCLPQGSTGIFCLLPSKSFASGKLRKPCGAVALQLQLGLYAGPVQMHPHALVGLLEDLRIDASSLSKILQCSPIVAKFQLGQTAVNVAGDVGRVESQSLVEVLDSSLDLSQLCPGKASAPEDVRVLWVDADSLVEIFERACVVTQTPSACSSFTKSNGIFGAQLDNRFEVLHRQAVILDLVVFEAPAAYH
mmetsp:Transcript_149573/g.264060  ORF Transcript_149573/g.264060 Transcript_149573/m.264060 type:complete len:202 (-) Transcript_149573:429-1034(-)